MIAFLLALALQAPAAPAAPERYVLIPSWTRTPTDAELAAARPRGADGTPLDGRAMLSCKVTAEGGLEACAVAVEKPAEAGFGAAALALADRFAMRPEDNTGATVRVPFIWPTPAPVAVPPPQ